MNAPVKRKKLLTCLDCWSHDVSAARGTCLSCGSTDYQVSLVPADFAGYIRTGESEAKPS